MLIQPNPTAMCVACLRSRVDITDGIPKQSVLYCCKGCDRYLSPPSQWVACALESRELLAMCLKVRLKKKKGKGKKPHHQPPPSFLCVRARVQRLKGLNKLHLVDAGFIWTEPHSKRIKVRVAVQKDVSGAVLEQVFVVEYVVHSQMCDVCHRREAKDTWKAVVQVRQKVPHKKTFFWLEQLIIKHQAQANAVNIKTQPDGLDFYFAQRNEARRLCEFLACVCPQRMKTSERLISHDIHTNEFNFKFSFAVEIVPVCKDDVVVLPRDLARRLGHIAPLTLCTRVASSLHFLDPLTLQTAELRAELYWAAPFTALGSATRLTEFVVLDIEPVGGPPTATHGSHHAYGRYTLADATVARVRDFGSNDTVFVVRTHLGRVLQPGDNAWGFDVTTANTNNGHANDYDYGAVEVVLVKKSYSDRRRRRVRRAWKLRTLEKEDGDAGNFPEEDRDFELFKQDLEEDAELRATINLYHGAS